MNDRRIDPVEEGIDLIVRSGGLDDSNLVVRRAGSARMGLFASPSYLAERNTPLEQTAELRQHELIGFTGPQFRGQSQLKAASEPDVLHLFSGDRRLSVSSAMLGREAALAGVGISMLPAFLVSQDIAAGRLVQVLPDVALPSMEVSFLHPFGNAAPQRVSAFMEFAIRSWRETGRLVP